MESSGLYTPEASSTPLPELGQLEMSLTLSTVKESGPDHLWLRPTALIGHFRSVLDLLRSIFEK